MQKGRQIGWLPLNNWAKVELIMPVFSVLFIEAYVMMKVPRVDQKMNC